MKFSLWNVYLLLISMSSWQFTSLLKPSDALFIPKTNATLEFLQRTFDTLDKSMTFFRREHRHVNLDSVLGTRIVEASMNIVLNRLETSGMLKEIPSHVIDRITRLRDESSDISNATVPFIFLNEPDYFAEIGPLLRPGVFQLNYNSRDVTQRGLVWPYNPNEVMREEDSDDCLAEIFGTSELIRTPDDFDIRTGVKCGMSQKCWNRMTTQGNNGYSLSHQIFYLEIAEGYGCAAQMFDLADSNSQPSIHYFHDMFCANMLSEADLIARSNFPKSYQDLFMEQAALCGILGYRGFFQFDWLEAILSWQDERDGCFKGDEWPIGIDRSSLKLKSRRVKREEKRVSRGCLCHRTSVAAAALAQYVRYILETFLEQKGEEAI